MHWRVRDLLERLLERLWYGKKGWAFQISFIPLGLLSLAARSASHRRQRLSGAPAPLPTIGVGNLVVGGSGKTQVALELARRAQRRGLRPAVLTRGYGGAVAESTVVDAASKTAQVGDEALMLARRLPDTVVVSGPDRLTSALVARRRSAQVAILDDGLQQRRIAVQRRVWVVSADSPFGNGHFLPLGPLRDSRASIAPEDVVWLHGAGSAPSGLPVTVRSRSHALGVVSAFDPTESPRPVDALRVAVFCGIARPQRFIATLQEAGAVVVCAWTRADHRVFSGAELLQASRLAEARGAAALVCTEKDAARLSPVASAIPILALRAELRITEGAEEIDALFDSLAIGG
jgi:tetraacyldisaccharide 4'-kinase